MKSGYYDEVKNPVEVYDQPGSKFVIRHSQNSENFLLQCILFNEMKAKAIHETFFLEMQYDHKAFGIVLNKLRLTQILHNTDDEFRYVSRSCGKSQLQPHPELENANGMDKFLRRREKRADISTRTRTKRWKQRPEAHSRIWLSSSAAAVLVVAVIICTSTINNTVTIVHIVDLGEFSTNHSHALVLDLLDMALCEDAKGK